MGRKRHGQDPSAKVVARCEGCDKEKKREEFAAALLLD